MKPSSSRGLSAGGTVTISNRRWFYFGILPSLTRECSIHHPFLAGDVEIFA